MKETTLPVTEFKAKCLRLLDQVARQGDSLVITKRGRPVARVVPVSAATRPLRGSWKNVFKANGDLVQFDVTEDWESSR
jgi:prevent-host-death family protein